MCCFFVVILHLIRNVDYTVNLTWFPGSQQGADFEMNAHLVFVLREYSNFFYLFFSGHGC